MARPSIVGRENWRTHARVGDCLLHDGTCFRHHLDHPLSAPRQSLQGRCPEIAVQLDEELSGFTAADVSYGASTVLAVWRCDNEHTYCASPNSRTNARGGTGCGTCASKRPSSQHNLAVLAPELVDEWDTEGNGGLTPDQVLPQSNTKYWWKCPVADDHRWEASPNNRFGKGSGCPMCAGSLASSTNNLTLNRRLMDEWDPASNAHLNPKDITLGNSTIKVHWRCLVHADSHPSWPATVDKRMQGRGCRACAGQAVTDTNSLAIQRPDLAAELDSTREPFKTADEISIGMNGDVWWRCPVWPDAHRWQVSPNARVSGNTGCPECKTPGSSKQEIRIAYELAHVLGFDPTMHSVPNPAARSGRELVDMVDSDRKLVIEFDGSYWHGKDGAQERDTDKVTALKSLGWSVVRVREAPLAPLSGNDVVIPFQGPTHDTVVRVLAHLTALGFVDVAATSAYAKAGHPLATEAADQAIRARREAAGAAKSQGAPGQSETSSA